MPPAEAVAPAPGLFKLPAKLLEAGESARFTVNDFIEG